MKIGKASEYVNAPDKRFQGKMPYSSDLTAHLLEPKETFSVSEKAFQGCCLYQDVSPVSLTPYDVARIRKTIGMQSSEFFDKYATLQFNKMDQFPWAFLNKNTSRKKKQCPCPFVVNVKKEGKDARPLACRIFPLMRAVDSEGKSYFAILELPENKKKSKRKKFTLETWLKHTDSEMYIEQSERFESFLRKLEKQRIYDFSNQQKMSMASMLYTPDAFATDDLFSYYLKKPEYALEALEFGYTRVKKLLEESGEIDRRKFR